jgi:hypothetical protein
VTGWDPIARDEWGAALSAGERCNREGCGHEWFGHDHAYAAYGSAGFGRCLAETGGGRCRCMAFYPRPINRPPEIMAPPLQPLPPEPPRPVPPPPPPPPPPPEPSTVPLVRGRHAATPGEPPPTVPTVPTTVPIPTQPPALRPDDQRTAPLGQPTPPR